MQVILHLGQTMAMLTHCSGVGNANALLGSFCLATLRAGAKLHGYRRG